MIGVEQLVRPIAFSDPLSRRRIVASPDKIEVEAATLVWGAAGTITAPNEIEEVDDGVNFTVITCDDQFQEVERESVIVRITRVDEAGVEVPDEFVDVERPTKLKFERVVVSSYNKTTNWTTAVETAVFSTTGGGNQKCYSSYKMKASE